MKIIKGYCSHCKNRDDKDRIFDITNDGHDCYCPYCGKKYTSADAHNNYINCVKKLIRDADKYYVEKGDYAKAYYKYGTAIAFEPNCIEGRLGRLLSLLCLSTVRRCRFNEARELLIDDKNDYLLDEHISDAIFFFAKHANNVIHHYVIKSKNLLTHNHKYFFDNDCLCLWLTHLSEAIKLRTEILQILNAHYEKKKINKYKTVIASYDNALANLEGLLSSNYQTINGETFKFSKIYGGKATITKLELVCKVHILPSQICTLDTLDKTKIPITDIIFPSFSINYYCTIIMPISAVVCALVTISTLIPFFFSTAHSVTWTVLLNVSLCFFVLSILSVVGIVISRSVLSIHKKRLNA